MGENITDEAAQNVARLTELANIYRNHERKNDSFLQALKSQGRQDLIELFLSSARRWFRVPPDLPG